MGKSKDRGAVDSGRRKGPLKGKEAAAPRCLAIADEGIGTGQQFAALMGALIADIAGKRIDPKSANAICNAGGKILRVVELQHRYGATGPGGQRILALSAGA